MHFGCKSLDVAHRRFEGGRAAQYLVEDCHLREPFGIQFGCRNLRARVAPFGTTPLPFFLGAAFDLVLSRAFQLAVEGPLADTGPRRGDIAEMFDFVGVELGGQDQTDKGVGSV